jgi:hypothetical protein
MVRLLFVAAVVISVAFGANAASAATSIFGAVLDIAGIGMQAAFLSGAGGSGGGSSTEVDTKFYGKAQKLIDEVQSKLNGLSSQIDDAKAIVSYGLKYIHNLQLYSDDERRVRYLAKTMKDYFASPMTRKYTYEFTSEVLEGNGADHSLDEILFNLQEMVTGMYVRTYVQLGTEAARKLQVRGVPGCMSCTPSS